MSIFRPVIVFLILLLLGACTGRRAGTEPLTPGEIYFDYKIRGDERDSNVTVYLQYRRVGPNGNTVYLGDAATVELDGELIGVDSSKLGGVYYEIRKPLASFAGEHEIVYTDWTKKKYRERFAFMPLVLRSERAGVSDSSGRKILQRHDVSFELEAFDTMYYVRVVATDTSFRSNDLHEIDTVKDGKIVLRAQQLRNLVNGPVVFQFSKELERPVTDRTAAGGKISISYGLQREFILKD